MIYLRSFLFQLCFYILTITLLITHGSRGHHFPEVAKSGYRLWAKGTLFLLKYIVKINLRIRGGEFIPRGPALIGMKHQSILETVLIFSIFDRPATVLKKELTKIPFASGMIYGAEHIPIDRKQGAKARKNILSEAKDRLARNFQVVIFPEGTRSEVNTTPSYKKGIFSLYEELNISCIPVALNTGMFWPKKSFLLHSGTVILEVLPPIGTGLSADIFMTKLTTQIEGATARLVQEAAAEQSYIKRQAVT